MGDGRRSFLVKLDGQAAKGAYIASWRFMTLKWNWSSRKNLCVVSFLSPLPTKSWTKLDHMVVQAQEPGAPDVRSMRRRESSYGAESWNWIGSYKVPLPNPFPFCLAYSQSNGTTTESSHWLDLTWLDSVPSPKIQLQSTLSELKSVGMAPIIWSISHGYNVEIL